MAGPVETDEVPSGGMLVVVEGTGVVEPVSSTSIPCYKRTYECETKGFEIRDVLRIQSRSHVQFSWEEDPR